jgi:hypothetical protein
MQNRKQIKISPLSNNQQQSGAFINQACINWTAGNIMRVYTNNPTFKLEH